MWGLPWRSACGLSARAHCVPACVQMVNRGSTAQAEAMEALSSKEVLAMLRFGADR